MSRCKSSFKVIAYRLDGSLFRIYDSARSAAKSRHAYPRTIDKCIRGDTTTAYGYMWRRYEDDNIPTTIEPYQKPTSTKGAIPIVEIDNNGDIIHQYSSIKKASEILDIDPHSIRDVLNGKAKQTKGHMFSYLNKEDNNDKFITGKKTVIQLTLDGKYIKQYPSIKKAAESIGKKPQGIQLAINGKYKTAYGYRWKYKK